MHANNDPLGVRSAPFPGQMRREGHLKSASLPGRLSSSGRALIVDSFIEVSRGTKRVSCGFHVDNLRFTTESGHQFGLEGSRTLYVIRGRLRGLIHAASAISSASAPSRHGPSYSGDLLANAATLVGRRANNAGSHGRCPVRWISAQRMTASAPAVNRPRRYTAAKSNPECVFPALVEEGCPSLGLVRHDKGDDFHEEARSINGRGAGSPEHRWLRAVCRQG
jgi:hypothetical protein